MGEKGYYVVGFKDTAAAKAHLSCRCDRACTQPLIDLFLLGCLLSGWSAAFAQATFTESQRLTFDAVEAHCGRTRPIFDSLSPQQQAWSNTCWELVTTNNRINNTGGPTGFAIDQITTEQQLGEAVQEGSPVEVLTQGRGAVESASGQFANIGARLEALRLGATGISVAGLSPNTTDHQLTGKTPLAGFHRGGAASADDAGFSRLGAFINGNFIFGDRDRTDRQDGFDFDSKGVTAGVDYRLTDSVVLGIAFGHVSSDVDIDGFGGELDSDSYNMSTFGTYYLGDFYVDGIFSYGWNDYDATRRIVYPSVNTAAKSDTDSQQYAINVGAGYDFHMNGFTLGPIGHVQYLHTDIDGYEESGAEGGHSLTVSDQTIKSLLISLGGRVNYAVSTRIGVFVPELRFEWNHEFENDTRFVEARYSFDPFNTVFGIPTDAPDRNYFTFGAGVSSTFAHGISGFVDYQTLVGLTDVSSHMVTAGIRVEF